MVDDPERRRVEELLDKVTHGQVSEAEREELALYSERDPDLEQVIAERGREGALGQGWLERVTADHEIQRVEAAPRARIERGVGLAFFAAGVGVSLVAPVTGTVALLVGLGILLLSFLRIRLQTARRDPYKDIQR
ncbi:MAG: hypothetical protein R3B09_12230 [Nannocystaceae bacterium]